MKIKHLLVAAVLFITGTAAVMAQGAQMPTIPVDPAVRIGKLPNGLTYYIRHNGYPEHRVNFYIAQRVGSIQEEEDQRGLAHFLEHMAFNGSENYPGDHLLNYLRSIGVEFGRDLNAYTAIAETVYNIDNVPSNNIAALDSCLLVLKDWSNGLTLSTEEIVSSSVNLISRRGIDFSKASLAFFKAATSIKESESLVVIAFFSTFCKRLLTISKSLIASSKLIISTSLIGSHEPST